MSSSRAEQRGALALFKPLSSMKGNGLETGCYLDGAGIIGWRCSALGALSGPRRSRFWSLSFVPLTAPCGSYHADLPIPLQSGCLPPSLVTQWAFLDQVLCANDLAACQGTLRLSWVTVSPGADCSE